MPRCQKVLKMTINLLHFPEALIIPVQMSLVQLLIRDNHRPVVRLQIQGSHEELCDASLMYIYGFIHVFTLTGHETTSFSTFHIETSTCISLVRMEVHWERELTCLIS